MKADRSNIEEKVDVKLKEHEEYMTTTTEVVLDRLARLDSTTENIEVMIEENRKHIDFLHGTVVFSTIVVIALVIFMTR